MPRTFERIALSLAFSGALGALVYLLAEDLGMFKEAATFSLLFLTVEHDPIDSCIEVFNETAGAVDFGDVRTSRQDGYVEVPLNWRRIRVKCWERFAEEEHEIYLRIPSGTSEGQVITYTLDNLGISSMRPRTPRQ